MVPPLEPSLRPETVGVELPPERERVLPLLLPPDVVVVEPPRVTAEPLPDELPEELRPDDCRWGGSSVGIGGGGA
jgi:hypothetical protein